MLDKLTYKTTENYKYLAGNTKVQKFIKLKLNRIEQNRIEMLDKLTLVNSIYTVIMNTVN